MGLNAVKPRRTASNYTSQAEISDVRVQYVERIVAKADEEAQKTVKVLLLGSGGCGKTTIIKQLRLMHGGGFTEQEIVTQKAVILENLAQAVLSLIRAMEDLDISFSDNRNELNAVAIKQLTEHLPIVSCEIDENLILAIKQLWEDSGMQACFHRAHEFNLMDSTAYLLDNVERICHASYRPNTEDVLRSRIQTTSIYEIRLDINNVPFRFTDVGGQKAQRRKWIHCFDNVDSVIFVVGVSEYNQVLSYNGVTENRLQDSMRLFETTCNSQWFSSTTFILFLNKKDIFAEKIQRFDIKTVFPDYPGAQTYEECILYIGHRFRLLNANEQRRIYTHRTCATDTNQVQKLLDSSIDMIIKDRMKGMGYA